LRRCGEAAITVVAIAITLAMTYYMVADPQGLPYRSGELYASSYEGLLLAIATNVAQHGLCNTWWCGFVDALRFSPILVTALLVPWALAVPHAASAFTAIMVVSLALLLISLGISVYRLSGSLPLALVAMLSMPVLEGFKHMVLLRDVSMILGLAMASTALLMLVETIRVGERIHALLFGLFTGLTALADLRALLFLAASSTALGALLFIDLVKRGIDRYALAYLRRRFLDSAIVACAVCCWWLAPALLPFGPEHCLSLYMTWSRSGLSSIVPFAAVAIILGTGFVRESRPVLIPLATALAALAATARYYPDTATFIALILGLAAVVPNHGALARSRVAALCMLVLIACFAALSTASISASLRNSMSYTASPQFQVARYLERNCGHGCRALVIGVSGGWWIQFFDSKTSFVAGPAPQLCIFSAFSSLPSRALCSSPGRVLNELRSLCVEYVVTQSRLLSESSTLSKLVEKRVLVPVTRFSSIVVLRVSGALCVCSPRSLGVGECIAPTKIVGATASALCGALYVARSRRERILETLEAHRAR